MPISKNLTFPIYDNSQYNPNIKLFDLISSGLRLKLSIGIDFTGSNGHPLDQNTLHCIIDDKPNDYERVIKSITVTENDEMYFINLENGYYENKIKFIIRGQRHDFLFLIKIKKYYSNH